jgi:hypothetical protein
MSAWSSLDTRGKTIAAAALAVVLAALMFGAVQIFGAVDSVDLPADTTRAEPPPTIAPQPSAIEPTLPDPDSPTEEAATEANEVTDATEASSAEAPAEQAQDAPPAVRPPSFDIVRVDGEGNTVIAGLAEPFSQVTILLDGAAIDKTQADGGGNFVSLLFIEPSGTPRILGFLMQTGDGRELGSAETVIIGAIEPPLVVAEAEAEAEAPEPNTPVVPSEEAAMVAQAEPPIPAATDQSLESTESASQGEESQAATTAISDTPAAAEENAPVVAQAELPAQIPPDQQSQTAAPLTETADSAPAITSDETPDVVVQTEAPVKIVADQQGEDVAQVAQAAEPRDEPAVPTPGAIDGTVAEAPAETPEPSDAAITQTSSPETVVQTAEPEISLAVSDLPDQPDEAVAEVEAAAPTVLLATDEGISVLQPGGAAPEVLKTIALDSISYDPSGDVVLAGRGTGQGYVRVYLNNTPIKTLKIEQDGRWRAPLPQVATGVYTLRIDEIDESGTVLSRVEIGRASCRERV